MVITVAVKIRIENENAIYFIDFSSIKYINHIEHTAQSIVIRLQTFFSPIIEDIERRIKE